jgi:urease accessory protein
MLGAMLMNTPPLASAPAVPAFVRAAGGVRVAIGRAGGGSAPLTIAESGGYRIRFSRSGEGILINTGGGMTGGDRMRIAATVRAGAAAVLTTQAAEKIYRSDGPDTDIAAVLALENGARLDWLPQEQILFDGARLRRAFDVGMAADASLLMVESLVIGRAAMGEVVRSGLLLDRWRIRRGGRLVFAEDVRLDGALDRHLARRAVAGGARALATVLHVAPDAESRAEEARALLAGADSECGASAFDGMLVARFLSFDPQALRADLSRFIEGLRGTAMPRSWQT